MKKDLKLTKSLLNDLGFEYNRPYWIIFKNNKCIAPKIYQEGDNFYILTDSDNYPGLKQGDDPNKRKIETFEDLYNCYDEANVINILISKFSLCI